jgi:hypothetical protein
VTKFVSKFRNTQLMPWEVSLWRKKIVKTRADAQEKDDCASVISDLESDDLLLWISPCQVLIS